MEFLLDNPEVEQQFKSIIKAIPAMQNGETASVMIKMGVQYEKNWGVSVVDLKSFASKIEKNHLLALKLWNKKWRETMILSILLEEPAQITEEQMDFWVKTSAQIEIIELCVFNLVPFTPFAYSKALEWMRSKKFHVKVAGLLSMGRLAMIDRSAIDEMFEPFFELLLPLSKDKALTAYFYRSYCQLARRSKEVHQLCIDFLSLMQQSDSETAQSQANELLAELTSDFYQNENIFIA